MSGIYFFQDKLQTWWYRNGWRIFPILLNMTMQQFYQEMRKWRNERKNIFESNRAAWNQTSAYHQKARNHSLHTGFQDPEFSTFKRERDSVVNERLKQMGFSGKTIAHIPCNNGRELLSLMRPRRKRRGWVRYFGRRHFRGRGACRDCKRKCLVCPDECLGNRRNLYGLFWLYLYFARIPAMVPELGGLFPCDLQTAEKGRKNHDFWNSSLQILLWKWVPLWGTKFWQANLLFRDGREPLFRRTGLFWQCEIRINGRLLVHA